MSASEGATARVGARPAIPVGDEGPSGLQPLGLGSDRDGFLLVPPRTRTGPRPLVVSFHGAGGSGDSGIARLQSAAGERDFLVVAPDSRGPTWDAVGGTFGPDVAFIDRVLERVFDDYEIDPSLVAVEGFSDGATYALSLGISNGDLFKTILAFSPGFSAAAGATGEPRVWISHGTEDRVLPIDSTSRRLATALVRSGFKVRYTEFEGGHTTPRWMTAAACKWWLGL